MSANKKSRTHTAAFWALIFCSGLGIIFLILPASYMKTIYFQEREMAKQQLGEETFHKIELRSSDWFKRIIVDTGVLSASYSICERKGKDRFDDRGLGALVANRLDVFWVAVRQMFFRVVQIYIWWPCALVIFLPLWNDAYQQLQVRRYQSSAASVATYHVSSKAVILLILALILGPLIPYSLPPLIIPLVLGLLGLAFWWGLAYMPKRA